MKRLNHVITFLILTIIFAGFISNASAQNNTHPWDVNGDAVVDMADLIFVASHFGDSNPVADVNGDELVDILDLVLVGIHLGEEYREITGKDNAPMVLIPAGEFEMGDAFNEGWDSERPVHETVANRPEQ